MKYNFDEPNSPYKAAEAVVIDHPEVQRKEGDEATKRNSVVASNDRHQRLECQAGHGNRHVEEASIDKSAARISMTM